jgi:ABC-type transport system involved in cytochrome c biogenesis permease subunit
VIAFAVAVTYLWVEARTESPYTGPFLLFLVLIFIVVSSFFPKLDREVPEILQSKLFSVHVSAAVLGYSGFAVAAVYGLLYLLLYNRIRTKSFGLFFRRLPPLDVLDRMNVYAATAGFLFLTVAIVAGSIWSTRIFGEVRLDPKVLIALLTWAIYGVALASRRFVHFSGQKLAYSSLFGFLVVLFSMFAVNFLLSSFHVFTS